MNKRKWVMVGGDTLAGREVSDYIDEHHLPVALVATSSGPEECVLTESEGEVAIMEPLDESALEGAEAVLLAGSAAVNERARGLACALSPRPALIDLTGGLESHPDARLRAPGIESAPRESANPIEIVAHPAAVALAKLLRILNTLARLRSAVVTVFEPASANGKAALDELHNQTVSLFNFSEQPKKVFDAQVSFNLLPRYGHHAQVASLEATERRIEQHLTTLLAPAGLPPVSLRVVQAPVFHGYCQSVWAEFESRPDAASIERSLKQTGADVRSAHHEPASNTAAVGQSGIMVSDIKPDAANPRGVWLWLASDNLRTVAETAVLIAGLAHKEHA